jgi:hypothetical protein
MKVCLYHISNAYGRAVLVLDPDAVKLPAELMIAPEDATEISIASDDELSSFAGSPAEAVWHDLLTKGWHILPERRAHQRASAAIAQYQRAGAMAKR